MIALSISSRLRLSSQGLSDNSVIRTITDVHPVNLCLVAAANKPYKIRPPAAIVILPLAHVGKITPRAIIHLRGRDNVGHVGIKER